MSFISSTLYAEKINLSDGSFLQGHFTQGGLVFGTTDPDNQVKYEQQDVHVSSQGDFIIAFGRDENLTPEFQLIMPSGQSLIKRLQLKKRQYAIQHINGLAKSKVSPQKPTVLARIKKERQQVAQARLRDDARTDYRQAFIWPAQGRISGVYGSQRVLNGKPKWPHYGVDVAAPIGTQVRAPAAGIITLANDDLFYSGGTIILDHGHGLSSSFLHLSELLVDVGDKVKQGDLIARVGVTGRATGAHLDWRMNWLKRRIDPALLVPPMNTAKEDKKDK
ncbi:M23 family metallopeptidase [sulfur-oxidizing endosymbiont of Gigantopelta aegis]|uniref:M23 family metallopeptidase n=1 Tax=sulfur-oxidizing endosymbiont of Gigantopelta aegis TaxID=2794934 RepID=UPI001FEC00EE|nr:M23 family metallopeptidase [sulfur-oxidizing endosymbiont of Gigantopelta aegis]